MWAAAAISYCSSRKASFSMLMFPSASAVLPLMMQASSGNAGKKSCSCPASSTSSTTSSPLSQAFWFMRQPSRRGSTKVLSPTEVSTPGFFPAMARIMWDMTPCGAINSAKSPALMWG